MNNKLSKILFLIGYFSLSGCASYTFSVIDSERVPIDGLPVDVLDVEKNFILNADSKGKGKYAFSENAVTDSFFIRIDHGNYFPLEQGLSKKDKSPSIILAERMTAVVGYVIDDSTLQALGGCKITTLPETEETVTGSRGKFVLKSEKFGDMEYTIFINKTDYVEGNTTFKPRENEIDTLFQTIFLKPVFKDDITIKGKGIHIPIDDSDVVH